MSEFWHFFNSLIGASWLERAGMLTGLACIYYEVKEHYLTWPAGIVSSAIYAVFLYQDHLYGQMSFQIITLPISIWGWYQWLKPDRDRAEASAVHIHYLSASGWIYLLSATIVGALAAYSIKYYLPTLQFAFADMFSAYLGVIALFMLGKKLIEQWILWIIADGVPGVIMYLQGYYPSAILFACYTLMAVIGYYNWYQLKKEQDASRETQLATA